MGSSFLKFWGVRGSIPTPGPETVRYGGNTSCIELRLGGQIVIVDAGTGIRALGLSLAAEFAGVPLDLTLLISHMHWDHIQGFPFFRPAYNPANRLHILGYEGARARFSTILSAQMESPYFPVDMKELPANIEIRELKEFAFDLGGIPVRAQLLNHPGITAGYRIETGSGAVAILPDNEPQEHLRMVQALSGVNVPAGCLARAEVEDAALLDFIRDAEILIIDSQYTVAEYPAHVGWGHGAAEVVTALAIRAGVRQLFLFHHDPCQSDAMIDEKLASCRKIAAGTGLQVEAASEGLVVSLD